MLCLHGFLDEFFPESLGWRNWQQRNKISMPQCDTAIREEDEEMDTDENLENGQGESKNSVPSCCRQSVDSSSITEHF